MTDPSVAIIIPDRVRVANGTVQVATKTLSGLLEEFQNWSGEVSVIASPTKQVEVPGATSIKRSELPFKIYVTEAVAPKVQQLNPDLTTALLSPSNLPTLTASLPGLLVPYAEYDLRNRTRYALETSRGMVDTARIRAGAIRQERQLRQVVRNAAGLQSNGLVAHRAYGHLNRNSMCFFDSRATRACVEETSTSFPDRSDGPLRLAFSGRWIPQKGFHDAIKGFLLARGQGLNATLDLFGGGELASAIPDDDQAIRVRGSIPFEPNWTEFIRNEVDALLIPHRQGDPSCTYIEGMACGAPFISYANDTASALAELSAGGWTVPMGDRGALADLLISIDNHRDLLHEKRYNGIKFARDHSFEREYGRRAAHLQGVWESRRRR